MGRTAPRPSAADDHAISHTKADFGHGLLGAPAYGGYAPPTPEWQSLHGCCGPHDRGRSRGQGAIMAKCAKRRRFSLLRQLRRRRAVRAAMGMESLEPRAMLATLYWDPNGAAAGLGGSGTWDLLSANWTTDPGVRWRHPAYRIHHRSGPDPEDPHAPRRTARASARLAGPWPAGRLGRAPPGPRRPGDFSGTDRRAARDRHPQPLTAFHATVRTAREKSGFKAGLRRREKSGLERG